MFSIFADSLTILLTILFPVFASYKALEASDPAQITPWLIYWVVFSLATCAESIISFFYLDWLPFYSWVRLGVHLYLLLPGEAQGAGYIYNRYVKPFLLEHERSIEGFISDGHAKLKTAGLDYVNQAVDYARYNLLGQQPPARPTAASLAQQTYANYAQSLLARFTMPRESTARPPNAHQNTNKDIYTLLSTALGTTTTASSFQTSSPSGVPRVASNQRIIPASISDPSDRASYISATRERLRALLSAVDREEAEVGAATMAGENSDDLAYGYASSEQQQPHQHQHQHRSPSQQHHHQRQVSGGTSRNFRKVESETDFESINHEDLSASGMGRVAAGAGAAAAGAGNWGSWVWGRNGAIIVSDISDIDSSSGHPRAVSSSASATTTLAPGIEARRTTSSGAVATGAERHRSSHDRHERHQHHRRDS